MARAHFGTLITDMRGRLGGYQLRDTRTGIILAPLANRRTEPTSLQTVQRAIVATTRRLWKDTLTQAERDAWITLAATVNTTDPWGQTSPMAGGNLYTRVNAKRLAAGLTALTTPPTDQVVVSPATATLTAPGGTALSFAWTATPAPADTRVKIYAARAQSPGTSTAVGRFHKIQLSAAAAASPADFTAAFTTLFGALSPGKKIFAQLSFWNQSNGAESPHIEADVTI